MSIQARLIACEIDPPQAFNLLVAEGISEDGAIRIINQWEEDWFNEE